MLVEKEVIAPGTYYYRDLVTDLPRKFVATPEYTKHLHEQGNKMLALGLTVPVPYEHDFSAHPMTPKDKLLNNAGWVKEYRLKGDTLWSIIDIQDDKVAEKLPKTIRFTSPWFNSFTDGDGRRWDNVVAHLALTTRPRITKQAPFGSIAAAMSFALGMEELRDSVGTAKDGLCISKAGRLVQKDKKLFPDLLFPEFPVAFSLYAGGIKLADDDAPPPKKKGADPTPGDGGGGEPPPPAGPLDDQTGDVGMPQLLGELLSILGVQMPPNVTEGTLTPALCMAIIARVREIVGQQQGMGDNMNKPNNGQNQTPPNPLIQQEQQPMYMSLEDINKITDPTMKNIALSMYNENVKLRAEADADRKKLNSLNDAKLKEEGAKRANRVLLLGKLSPKVKADLDAMLALPGMALSMGEGGAVVDPMAQTLAVLEKGLADMPRLLTTEQSALSVQPQPTDGEMSQQEIDATADNLSRMMGYPAAEKKAG